MFTILFSLGAFAALVGALPFVQQCESTALLASRYFLSPHHLQAHLLICLPAPVPSPATAPSPPTSPTPSSNASPSPPPPPLATLPPSPTRSAPCICPRPISPSRLCLRTSSLQAVSLFPSVPSSNPLDIVSNQRSYNVTACAQACDATPNCKAFNIYFAREPKNAIVAGVCERPEPVTSVHCALYSASLLDAERTTNERQRVTSAKDSFERFQLGSNGTSYRLSSPSKTNH